MNLVPNPKCCGSLTALCPECKEGLKLMKKRQQNKLTATFNQLVLNQPFKIRPIRVQPRRKSVPLVPPKLHDVIDPSPSREARTLNYSPDMLLPPNTMQVVVNCRETELAAADKRDRQSVPEPSRNPLSGPLIPPSLY